MQQSFSTKGFTSRNEIRLIRGGAPYFSALLQLINDAQHALHLQMYIFEPDETGQQVLNALCAAAQRGVRVYFLLDGYASQQLHKTHLQQLLQKGVKFRWFEPLLKSHSFYFGRRLHQKVCVADALYALVGGINISNRYNDLPNQPAWLDWAVWVKGEVALKLYRVCIELWTKAGWMRNGKREKFFAPDNQDQWPTTICYVRARRQDWVRFRTEIASSYLQMIQKSEREVILLSSYFLPGRKMRKAIIGARLRGVDVQVIATGKSDVWIAKQAERYLYRWMLKNNVQLYEYQTNVLHGKLACADNTWVTIGSFNINFISAYASVELNLEVIDEAFTAQVKTQLQQLMQLESVRILPQNQPLAVRFWTGLLQKTCYDLVRLIFFLFTFYYRQRRS